MKLIKVLITSIIFILLITASVYAVEPEITATSAAIIDCTDGKILYSKNMEEKLYPASLTNVLTAILAVEKCNMQDEVVISENAINSAQSGYLTANLKPGEKFMVEQLVNLLLISSYSDVANALAEHIAGGIDEFAVMMNQKAKEIGCTKSNFVNANGEHDTNHYSTAHDMVLIGNYAMKYKEIRDIVAKTEYILTPTELYTEGNRVYYTTNEMLKSSSTNYYKYAKGLKTAFTTPAGNCLMIYSEKNDMPLVAVVMKSTTSDSRYQDCKTILEYAYLNNTLRTIAVAGTNLQTLNVKGGSKDTKKINAILESNVKAVVKSENKKSTVDPEISINNNLKAPISKGEVIGTVSYEIEGKIYSASLIAETEVEKSHTGLVFILIFIGLIIILGLLRIKSLQSRAKTLKKIRGK